MAIGCNYSPEFRWDDDKVAEIMEQAAIKCSMRGCINAKKEIERYKELKTRTPLFTTEDGVAIYSWHEVVWFVNSAWNIGSQQASSYDVEKSSHLKYFYSGAKAEEYVLQHKPCLSYRDVYEWARLVSISLGQKSWNSLEEKIKSKLK